MFLQISCNTSHSCCKFTEALFTFSFSMYLHTCSMMFMTGLRAGQFKNCQAAISLLILLVFLDYPSCVLGVVIVLENVINKLLPIRAFPSGTEWWTSICGIWVMKVYRCPTPLNVIESQTCRDRPPAPHSSHLVL